MSPSWLERADIVFAAGALEFSRSRWPRKAQIEPRRVEVVAQPGDAVGTPIWRACLDALAPLLAAERPATARVRLSGRFCRFALAPWTRGLTADEERALARAVLLETYGDAAHGWEVRVDNLQRGAAFVACAVDAALIAGLHRVFDAAGWRLGSVEPLFAVALARDDAPAGPPGPSWNALLESDWCSAALMEGDAVHAMCAAPVSGDPGAIVRSLANENTRLSRDARSLRFLRGGVAVPAAGEFSGWTVTQAW